MPRQVSGAPVILVVTGIRDLHPDDEPIVWSEMDEAVATHKPEAVVFGGARGVDSVALRAVAEYYPRMKRIVIVPGRVDQQPRAAQYAIVRCATEVVELALDLNDKSAWIVRNEEMLRRGSAQPGARVIGFTDGSASGGTARTVESAKNRWKIPVTEVRVRRQR